ncbi:MAG: MOSC N-terminal beta barrel domain-containing protein [Halioglobus sp.]
MKLGSLRQIWRYPVKSMGGEVMNSVLVKPRGLAGDRCWALVDNEAQEIVSAKRWPELLNFMASLCAGDQLAESGYDAAVPDVEITCPSGHILRGRDPGTGLSLSALLEKSVSLLPLAPPQNTDHYRARRSRTIDTVVSELGLVPGASSPDPASRPDDVMAALGEFVTPPGTYVDAYPVHLLTTNSLDYLTAEGGIDAVVQRFRPNLMIEPVTRWPRPCENDWVGCRVQLGQVIIRIHSRTVRCSMPARQQSWCGLQEAQCPAAHPAGTLRQAPGRKLHDRAGRAHHGR